MSTRPQASTRQGVCRTYYTVQKGVREDYDSFEVESGVRRGVGRASVGVGDGVRAEDRGLGVGTVGSGHAALAKAQDSMSGRSSDNEVGAP